MPTKDTIDSLILDVRQLQAMKHLSPSFGTKQNMIRRLCYAIKTKEKQIIKLGENNGND